MRKALFVAYFFPPLGGAGVQRTTKFIKYLPKFGWNSAVLTAKNPTFLYYDESLFKDIPSETKIYRSFHFDPFGGRFKKTLKKTDAEIKPSLTQFLKTLFKNSSRFVYRNFFPLETLQIWSLSAYFKGLEIIKKDKVDLIYSTFSPAANHFIAYFLKKKTGLPWVADFRDVWIDSSVLPLQGPRKVFESFLERLVAKNSDKIVVVSDSIGKNLIEKYNLDHKKVITITNGYDDEDFKVKGEIDPMKFTITYTGSIYRTRSPATFFRALKNLFDEIPSSRKTVEVNFIGDFLDKESLNLVEKLDLRENVNFLDYVPHKEAIKRNLSSDLLFLVVDYKDSKETG